MRTRQKISSHRCRRAAKKGQRPGQLTQATRVAKRAPCPGQDLMPEAAHPQAANGAMTGLGIPSRTAHFLLEPVAVGSRVFDKYLSVRRITDCIAPLGDQMRDDSILSQRILRDVFDKPGPDGVEVARQTKN